MEEPKCYVRVDEHGVMRVENTRVMLDSVIAAFDKGHSPETIRSQYPSLTLEQVYGAIAYYLSHDQEVGEYLHRQDALWEKYRAEAEQCPSAVVERLRAIKRARAGQPS
jgi:uncharacterized protein (DUF433 family)